MNDVETLRKVARIDGSQYINDTNRYKGSWCVLQVITNTVIDELVDSTLTGSLNGVSLAAGTTIYGNFTAIKLTSGTVMMYI